MLVVDDECGPRESLRLILESRYSVRTAGDGSSALEILSAESVDVVTLDLKMPGEGGIDTFHRIREIDPNIEVIIITGYGSYHSAVRALRLGAFDYIGKPFDAATVLEIVGRALRRRVARRTEIPAADLENPVEDLVREADRLERTTQGLPKDDRASLRRIRYLARTIRYLSKPAALAKPGGAP